MEEGRREKTVKGKVGKTLIGNTVTRDEWMKKTKRRRSQTHEESARGR